MHYTISAHDEPSAQGGKMGTTQQFITKVEDASAEEVRTNFEDLFNEALAIEVSEWLPGESHEPGSAPASRESSTNA